MAESTLKSQKLDSEVARAVREVKDAILEMNVDQSRQDAASSLRALGNSIAVGWIIGRAFSKEFDLLMMILGVILVLVAYYMAKKVEKGGDRQ